MAFVVVLAVQLLTAVADNALVFGAIALLRSRDAPPWQIPVLQQSFVVAFIVLAPFVGHLADAWPKGRVMLLSNAVKSLGCLMMLADIPPLLGYAWVGVGAALYSPAKYGILSEIFPAERLVWANGWMEGITVVATIVGAVSGSTLAADANMGYVQAWLNEWGFGHAPAPLLAIAATACCYAISAAISLRVPATSARRLRPPIEARSLVWEFRTSWYILWHDAEGRLSIVVTSLLWGVGTALRFLILSWSAEVLQYSLEQGARLTALVVIGIAAGAAWAGQRVPLAQAVRVLRVGMAMGAAVMAMALVSDWRAALPLLLLIGALGGYFMVPMNALLQHRGHLLVGAGHSIALQNAGENLSILLLLGSYALLTKMAVPDTAIVTWLGLGIVVLSGLFTPRRHRD